MEIQRSTIPRGDIIIQSDALAIGNDNTISLTVNNLNIDMSTIIAETLKAKDLIIEHLRKDNEYLKEMLETRIKQS